MHLFLDLEARAVWAAGLEVLAILDRRGHRTFDLERLQTRLADIVVDHSPPRYLYPITPTETRHRKRARENRIQLSRMLRIEKRAIRNEITAIIIRFVVSIFVLIS